MQEYSILVDYFYEANGIRERVKVA